MKETKNDPVIDEIREVRHRISERFGHDPSKLVAYYMELQKQYGDRLVQEQGGTRQYDSAVQEDRSA